MAGKVRNISSSKRIRKISGGKDPVKLVDEFVIRQGYEEDNISKHSSAQLVTWTVWLSNEEMLEIALEGLGSSLETTMYIGVNVLSIPITKAAQVMAAVLTVADSLISAKLSLVDYDIVLSSTIYASNINMEDIEYLHELVIRQKEWVQEAVVEELGLS